MNLFESAKLIKSLLEWKKIDDIETSFDSEDITIGDRTFVLTGSVSAILIDDSDYDREYGYGTRIYPSNFEYNIDRVLEVIEDGTEVDVSNDPDVLDMVEEFMKEKLSEDPTYYA